MKIETYSHCGWINWHFAFFLGCYAAVEDYPHKALNELAVQLARKAGPPR